jgi:XTP/dITP diphosphohydrolase
MLLKELVFATQNANKVAEVQLMMPKGLKLLSLSDINFFEPIPELADSLIGNAEAKAIFVKNRFKMNCFADDTGLEVNALNGAPGVFSARYAGPECDSKANITKLLRSLKDVKERSAQFRTVIVLILGKKSVFFEGTVTGEILRVPRGEGGFGYDAIFQPHGHDRSFAEFSAEEKNQISHRGIAFKKLKDYLSEMK